MAGIMDVLEDRRAGMEKQDVMENGVFLYNARRHGNVREIPGGLSDRHLYKYGVPAQCKQELVSKTDFGTP